MFQLSSSYGLGGTSSFCQLMIILSTNVCIFVKLGSWRPALLGELRERALRATVKGFEVPHGMYVSDGATPSCIVSYIVILGCQSVVFVYIYKYLNFQEDTQRDLLATYSSFYMVKFRSTGQDPQTGI